MIQTVTNQPTITSALLGTITIDATAKSAKETALRFLDGEYVAVTEPGEQATAQARELLANYERQVATRLLAGFCTARNAAGVREVEPVKPGSERDITDWMFDVMCDHFDNLTPAARGAAFEYVLRAYDVSSESYPVKARQAFFAVADFQFYVLRRKEGRRAKTIATMYYDDFGYDESECADFEEAMRLVTRANERRNKRTAKE